MIDYLIRFDDEDAARASAVALPYLVDGEWITSVVIPGVRVYTVTGTAVDDEGNEVESREYLPYWYLWVALPSLDETLAARSMVVADRESRQVLSSLIPQHDWPMYHCDPVIAGSDYPFGVG